MKKNVLFLSVSIFAFSVFSVGMVSNLSHSRSFLSSATDSTTWYHYNAVEPTTYTNGCHEYWTDCNGTTVMEAPTGGVVVDRETTAAIINTFESTDPRYIHRTFGEELPVVDSEGKKATFGRYPSTYVGEELNATLEANKDNLFIFESWYVYNGELYFRNVAPTPRDFKVYFSDGTRVVTNSVYWFKVEPLTWTVLNVSEANTAYNIDASNNERLFVCDSLIEFGYYYINQLDRTINETTVYANNYEYSNLRAFLNGYDGSEYNVTDYTNTGFLQKAFVDTAHIKTTTVVNSVHSESDVQPYLCSDTIDKVFAPSYNDIFKGIINDSLQNANFGGYRPVATASDYLRCSGIEDDYFYSLRSPFDSKKYSVAKSRSFNGTSSNTTTYSVDEKYNSTIPCIVVSL